MTKKDQKIIEDAERLGIPIFVLTAKDKCSAETLRNYLFNCSGEGCTAKFLHDVHDRIYEFDDWQHENKDSVKLPD